MEESAIDTFGVGTQKELDQLLAECMNDTLLFCNTFFPDVFFRPWSQMHRDLGAILNDDSKQLVAIAAPRGIGKTSLFNMAFPAKRLLFQESNYIIPISATADAAVEQSEDLKDQLIENEYIRAVFGPQQPQNGADSFGQKVWTTRERQRVLPRGAGQTIRGKKWRSGRPDLFVIDDLEDDESVENPELRDKLYRWLFSAVVNSVDRGSKGWRVLMIGTVLHEDSILQRLFGLSDWHTVRYEICDDQYNSNWPEFISTEDVKQLAASYKEKGMLEVFYREFRNIPIALEEQGFRPENFVDYTQLDESDPRFADENTLNHASYMETVILSDPARTMKKGSANTAVVAITINRRSGLLYVRDVVEGQLDPDQLYKEMLDMAERFNALVLAPETTGLHEYILWPLRHAIEQRRPRKHYVIVEVKPRESKTGPKRSGGLVPLYRQGKILHNGAACGSLERYLMQWPRPEKWDVIDCVSGIIFAMQDGERYLSVEDGDEDDPLAVEKEYDELDYDDDELEPLMLKSVI